MINEGVAMTPMSPTPRGVGGLKSQLEQKVDKHNGSHPSRGGWIEITVVIMRRSKICRPTPRGVGGLKLVDDDNTRAGRPVPPLAGWVD